jgi:hypothetical protein
VFDALFESRDINGLLGRELNYVKSNGRQRIESLRLANELLDEADGGGVWHGELALVDTKA